MTARKHHPAPGFFDGEDLLQRVAQTDHVLFRIDKLVEWERFRPIIDEVFKIVPKKPGGRPPYDRMMMFKVMVIKHLYNIPDGMIPEFIGRLPMVGAVRSLDLDSLVRILTEPKNALVKQYQKVFEFEDVELEFSADGLVAVAEQALLRGTGARGLRAILEEVLLNTMYELPGRTDVGRVLIDEKAVREKVNPTLVPRETGRATRPRRAAS